MSSTMPEWITVNDFDRYEYLKTKKIVNEKRLVTVCEEANCPNRYECFSKGTATFMILGDVCTRNCRYCNIKTGIPKKIDKKEPQRIAESIKALKLKYAVITCVTRDDLDDGGAKHFANTVTQIRKINPECKIELLISDLKGDWNSLKTILDSKPDVLNHNIETVKELFPRLRSKGDYERSIMLLKKSKEINSKILTKSGIMLGLGETEEQIIQTIKDLKEVNCDILTIGQYLQPSPLHFQVKKYYSPTEFKEIKTKCEKLGIKKVVAGPLVRSSYNASELI